MASHRWSALTSLTAVHAIHNELYYDQPPMGWRSWNCFGGDVWQDLMQEIVDEVVKSRIGLDGEPTSFLQLVRQPTSNPNPQVLTVVLTVTKQRPSLG